MTTYVPADPALWSEVMDEAEPGEEAELYVERLRELGLLSPACPPFYVESIELTHHVHFYH